MAKAGGTGGNQKPEEWEHLNSRVFLEYATPCIQLVLHKRFLNTRRKSKYFKDGAWEDCLRLYPKKTYSDMERNPWGSG